MIAPPDATAQTMRRALNYSIAALDTASRLDMDRTADDRTFFAQQKAGKQETKADLEQRVQQQNESFTARDEGNRLRSKFTTALMQRIIEGSDALYLLEKALLSRFIRERVYVRQFFLETRTSSKAQIPEPDPNSSVN
jgi:hypothetical protein